MDEVVGKPHEVVDQWEGRPRERCERAWARETSPSEGCTLHTRHGVCKPGGLSS